MRGNYIELRTKQIENLPVKMSSGTKDDSIIENIVNLVKEVVKFKKRDEKAETGKIEEKIDNLVFELYGISTGGAENS